MYSWTDNLMISLSGPAVPQEAWEIPQQKLLMVLYLTQGLEWILLVLIVLVFMVSIRIISTGKKYRKELNRLSDVEKNA